MTYAEAALRRSRRDQGVRQSHTVPSGWTLIGELTHRPDSGVSDGSRDWGLWVRHEGSGDLLDFVAVARVVEQLERDDWAADQLPRAGGFLPELGHRRLRSSRPR